jgi:hypothetical protein
LTAIPAEGRHLPDHVVRVPRLRVVTEIGKMKMVKVEKDTRRVAAVRREPPVQRITLLQPVEQSTPNAWDAVVRVVADLCLLRNPVPRGVVVPNFNRDRGPRQVRGPVWTSAPEGSFVFEKGYAHSAVLRVREDGALVAVASADAQVLWGRLAEVEGVDLQEILARTPSLQEQTLELFLGTFPELGRETRYVKRVFNEAQLPEEGETRSGSSWTRVQRYAREGWQVAKVMVSARPGHLNAYAVALATA